MTSNCGFLFYQILNVSPVWLTLTDITRTWNPLKRTPCNGIQCLVFWGETKMPIHVWRCFYFTLIGCWDLWNWLLVGLMLSTICLYWLLGCWPGKLSYMSLAGKLYEQLHIQYRIWTSHLACRELQVGFIKCSIQLWQINNNDVNVQEMKEHVYC